MLRFQPNPSRTNPVRQKFSGIVRLNLRNPYNLKKSTWKAASQKDAHLHTLRKKIKSCGHQSGRNQPERPQLFLWTLYKETVQGNCTRTLYKDTAQGNSTRKSNPFANCLEIMPRLDKRRQFHTYRLCGNRGLDNLRSPRLCR